MDTPKIFMLASQLANLGCDRCEGRVEWEVTTEESEENGAIIIQGTCECREYRFKVYMVEMLEVNNGLSDSELFG